MITHLLPPISLKNSTLDFSKHPIASVSLHSYRMQLIIRSCTRYRILLSTDNSSSFDTHGSCFMIPRTYDSHNCYCFFCFLFYIYFDTIARWTGNSLSEIYDRWAVSFLVISCVIPRFAGELVSPGIGSGNGGASEEFQSTFRVG